MLSITGPSLPMPAALRKHCRFLAVLQASHAGGTVRPLQVQGGARRGAQDARGTFDQCLQEALSQGLLALGSRRWLPWRGCHVGFSAGDLEGQGQRG